MIMEETIRQQHSEQNLLSSASPVAIKQDDDNPSTTSSTTTTASQQAMSNDKTSSPEHEEGSTSSKRKRKRLTISCLTCRKRKIKCDRQKPCSSCLKNNVPPHLCVYDESPWVSSLIKDNKMTNELLSLKQENEYLAGLLKMNEQELTSLKNLLIDLRLSGSDNSSNQGSPPPSVAAAAPANNLNVQHQEVTNLLREYFISEHKKEEFLLNQPINLGEFSCFKQTKFIVKVFGPSTWQNFVLDDAKTSYMLDSSISYIMDLISKNQRRTEQLKIVKLPLFNNTKINEAALRDMETYLGDYDLAANNIRYFCSVYQSAEFLNYLDDEKITNDFHTIIKRHPTTNNCQINIDLNSPNCHIEISNLSSLFLVLKFSIIFQDTTFELDKDEKLVSYAAHLFSSMMILEQPTLPAILALTLFQTYQTYTPLDFGAEIIPHGTSRDWSMCLMIAINSALKLGFHTNIPLKSEKDHYNYISPHHLRAFWRNVLFMDTGVAYRTGLPFAMNGYCDSRFLESHPADSLLTKQINDEITNFEAVICQKRLTVMRTVVQKFTTTPQSNTSTVVMKSNLVEDFKMIKELALEIKRTHKSLLTLFDPFDRLVLEDFFLKAFGLDAMLSSSYSLFLSFADPDHILNLNVDKSCFKQSNAKENFILLKRYFNSTMIMIVYGLRMVSWFLKRLFSDSYWSKNLIFQVLVVKLLKQICIKSFSLLLVMLIRNTRAFSKKREDDHSYLIYKSYFMQKENATTIDVFHMPFDDLEKLIYQHDQNYEIYNVENEKFLSNVIDLTSDIFKTSSAQKSFLTIDRKFYIAMELSYISILFCFRNCKVVLKEFTTYDEFINKDDFEDFKNFYNVDDVNFFRKQNYLQNKNEVMKVTSLLN